MPREPEALVGHLMRKPGYVRHGPQRGQGPLGSGDRSDGMTESHPLPVAFWERLPCTREASSLSLFPKAAALEEMRVISINAQSFP